MKFQIALPLKKMAEYQRYVVQKEMDEKFLNRLLLLLFSYYFI